MRQRTLNDPDYASKISETRSSAAKKMYDDRPELKQQRSEEGKRRFEDPKEREKVSKQSKEYWSSPEHREEQRQRQLDFIEDNPEITELRTEASREYWSDEESREKKSEQQEGWWEENPDKREDMSERLLGNEYGSGNKDKPKSEEHRRKIGDAHRGRKLSPEHIEKMRQSKLGSEKEILVCVACSDSLPRDEIISNDGFCNNCITHTKLCDCGCGEEIFRYRKNGKLRSYISQSHRSMHLWQDDEHRDAMVAFHTGRLAGDKNPNWKGGASFEPYDKNFTPEFKDKIRVRQNRICADIDETCIHPEGIKLDVHHIDGNKKNTVPENCIALCRSHHSRTNIEPITQTRYKSFIEYL